MCQDMGTSGYHRYNKNEIKRFKKRLEGMKKAVEEGWTDKQLVKKFGLNNIGVAKSIPRLEKMIKSGGYHWYEDSDLTCCGQGF